MALKIGAVVDTASRLLRDDAFGSAAKDGAAKTAVDRGVLSRAEQERYARYGLTYASADRVREERGEAGSKKSAPAALVYQTALKSMNDDLGEDLDREAPVTLEWLDELAYDSGGTGALLHLAAAESASDPVSFEERLESLSTFFGDNDIDMGGGVWIDTGELPRGAAPSDHARALLDQFIAGREESAEETFEKSHFVITPPGGAAAGIREAGLSIAADGFGESSPESALGHATQLASLVKRMGEGVEHVSASARAKGESLQGDTPVFASVHLFVRPNGKYVAVSSIGGQASRPWEPVKGAGTVDSAGGAVPARGAAPEADHGRCLARKI